METSWFQAPPTLGLEISEVKLPCSFQNDGTSVYVGRNPPLVTLTRPTLLSSVTFICIFL